MTLGVLSDNYISLLELYKFGPIKVKEIEWDKECHRNDFLNPNFKYFPEMLIKWNWNWTVFRGLIEGIEQCSSWDEMIHEPINKDLTITQEGIAYLNQDILKRKQRFHIKSSAYANAFFNILVENTPLYSEFEKEIAITHNGIDKNNNLTKVGEKYFINNLHKRLEDLLSVCVWTEETGPNRIIYTGKNDLSNWKETVKLDFKLINKIDGMGAILFPNVPAKHHQYLSLLLLSTSPEEVCEKIKERQKQNMDAYPFCYD